MRPSSHVEGHNPGFKCYGDVTPARPDLNRVQDFCRDPILLTVHRSDQHGGAIITVMASRDELKSLIDRVPEGRLEGVRNMLKFNINPPPPNPERDHMRERGQQYRKLVEQRFRETQKPGTISGFSGGGTTGMHKGHPFGRNGFHFWDGDALVYQSLQSFDGQEIEIMERLSLSADRSKLICSLELSSAGLTVQHSDEFPASASSEKGD